MAYTKPLFRQSDIRRAFDAARESPVPLQSIVFSRDGNVRNVRFVLANDTKTDTDTDPVATITESELKDDLTMKPRRSALPLPRYVLRKPLRAGTWAYFFNVPMWARKAGCPVKNEPLGANHDAAVQRAENILLPAFDAWRTGGDAVTTTVARNGTLDWVFSEYRADRRFTALDAKTKRNHEVGFRLVGGYVLKNSRRLGEMPVTAITTAVIDLVYEKLLTVTETDADGNTVERKRTTTVNHAMKTCRRAWNITARRNPGKLPLVNPFASMGLKSSDRETSTATYEDLQAFRAKAIEMGLPSLATAALIAWDWLQREADIFATFDVAHYRPKERPNAVRVIHAKTKEENWVLLFDENGVPLHPELMSELDAIKRDRIGGLMVTPDRGDRQPWPTWPTPDAPDLTQMSRKVKEVIRAAGLRDDLTFTSFRHGGFTESADADLSDAEIRAQGRHRSAKVLPRYAKRTMKQVAAGTKKRRAVRGDQP